MISKQSKNARKTNATIEKQKQNVNFYEYLQEKSKKNTKQLLHKHCDNVIKENVKPSQKKQPRKHSPQKKMKKKVQKSSPIFVDLVRGQYEEESLKCPQIQKVWKNQVERGEGIMSIMEARQEDIRIWTQQGKTQTSALKQYLIPLTKKCKKASISIWCEGKNGTFYDMLSMKKEGKEKNVDMVKTYINNTNKSQIILKKLLSFCEERQQAFGEQIQRLIVQISAYPENIGKQVQKVHFCMYFSLFSSLTKLSVIPGTHIVRITSNSILQALQQSIQPPQQPTEQQKLQQIVENLQQQITSNKQQLNKYIAKAMDMQNEELIVASERSSVGEINYTMLKNRLLLASKHSE